MMIQAHLAARARMSLPTPVTAGIPGRHGACLGDLNLCSRGIIPSPIDMHFARIIEHSMACGTGFESAPVVHFLSNRAGAENARGGPSPRAIKIPPAPRLPTSSFFAQTPPSRDRRRGYPRPLPHCLRRERVVRPKSRTVQGAAGKSE